MSPPEATTGAGNKERPIGEIEREQSFYLRTFTNMQLTDKSVTYSKKFSNAQHTESFWKGCQDLFIVKRVHQDEKIHVMEQMEVEYIHRIWYDNDLLKVKQYALRKRRKKYNNDNDECNLSSHPMLSSTSSLALSSSSISSSEVTSGSFICALHFAQLQLNK